MKEILEKIPNIDKEIVKKITEVLKDKFTKKDPIKIAVIGESGVGKTSTINALFKTELPISHFGSCTQNEEVVKAITPKGVPIEIIDMPGLWAGEKETLKHWETYRNILPTVDCAIWVISAGDRALQGMQNALKTISDFSGEDIVDRIVFGINKSEHMHPEDWNSSINLPSKEQKENLERFCITVKTAINEKFPKWNGNIVFYSAKKHFRLDELLEQMLICATPNTRLKVVSAADPLNFEDEIVDKRALNVAKKIIEKGE